MTPVVLLAWDWTGDDEDSWKPRRDGIVYMRDTPLFIRGNETDVLCTVDRPQSCLIVSKLQNWITTTDPQNFEYI
jgi:hypothetical protein